MGVSGHNGSKGYEEADNPPKDVANIPLPSLESFCGLSKSHINKEFQRWKPYCNNVLGQRQAKRLIPLSPKKAKQLVGLTHRTLLRYHLTKIGKSDR